MKKVEAVIRPFKLSEVQQELADAGIDGITVTEVKGYGSHKEGGLFYRGETHEMPATKVKIEVVVGHRDLVEVIAAIRRSAHTGNYGDGIIFVLEVQEAIRIRNGQRDEAAV